MRIYLFRVQVCQTVARYVFGEAVDVEALSNGLAHYVLQRACRMFAELSGM